MTVQASKVKKSPQFPMQKKKKHEALEENKDDHLYLTCLQSVGKLKSCHVAGWQET